MIQVKYNRGLNRVTVHGHAMSAPMGEDLVCSAASILVHTLAANIGHMEQAGIVTDGKADIQEGAAKLSCRASRGYENIVSSAFQSVCVGFEILAEKFPEYLSFKILG